MSIKSILCSAFGDSGTHLSVTNRDLIPKTQALVEILIKHLNSSSDSSGEVRDYFLDPGSKDLFQRFLGSSVFPLPSAVCLINVFQMLLTILNDEDSCAVKNFQGFPTDVNVLSSE